MATLHQAQLALSPLALYYCNETSGSTANDTSGNPNGPYNLTIGSSISKNSTKLVPSDSSGGSFFMNSATVGAAQTVTNTGALPSYLKPTTACSVEGVVQIFSASGGAGCFSLTSNGTIGLEQMMIGTLHGNTAGSGFTYSGNLVYSTNGTTPVQSNLIPSLTQSSSSFHIVLTFSGGGGAAPTANLYLNGVNIYTNVLPAGAVLFYPASNSGGPTMYNDSTLAIANPAARMSNFAIYGFGLTQSQVSSNYSYFLTGAPPSGGDDQQAAFNKFGGFQGFTKF